MQESSHGAREGRGVGASVRRKEDARLLAGRGRFVGDMRFPGQLEAAFLRAPLAHARIRAIHIPEHLKGRAFTHADMVGVKDILAKTGLPGFRVSAQPSLASGKVRFAGEPVVMVLAETRAQAEDLCEEIRVDYEELPANHDMLRAAQPGAALVHDEWPDNVFLVSQTDKFFDAEKLASAPVKVTREVRTSRQCMSPLEGKGCIAVFERYLEQLTLWTATQMPHIVRSGLAECLGLDTRKIRVVAPDVGGGFGWKGLLQPEEVCCAWAALKLDRPIKWLEDRREHLIAAANCREHHYVMTAYADTDGTLLGFEAVAHVDAGAYSVYPFSACLEGAQVVSNLPGPYNLPAYRCRTYSVCSNKPPIVPYRGVARTGVCTAMELMIDAVAREAGLDPYDVRMRNLVRPDQMPFTSITGKDFDMGDYPESLRRVREMIGHDAVRARQQAGEKDGRKIGLGYATYCEQGAHGTSVYHGWGIPMVPGIESCGARLTPDGTLEVRIGAQSHGQSMETTMAQVACEVLGIDPELVNVVHGDTALTPYSTGTWGSRSAVMSGGAVASACERLGERIKRIGAHLLQAPEEAVAIRDAQVVGPHGSVSFAEVAKTWYLAPQNLPADIHPDGLDLVAGYKPTVDTGTFSYASHAAVIAVEPETGEVEILDYVIVEDGGVLLNPMVVDGQIYGGTAQGIGTALYEEMTYDEHGQPLASTLADYLLPGAGEMPTVRIDHIQTPSPNTRFGQKGIGEGGAIAPPAALGNAINDALKGMGVELSMSPMTPRRVRQAVTQAQVMQAGEAVS
ncbi:xanthine dehydrogenase family protein molybdopterin-binding subunit [Ancylobacter sp. Lp-2]|uniref:xanthine dehydrogenase family protein molybdopterin-binding subunit n=1 Tax=Ancylobacter sp. Lp-2 TaxID=2881339 RepID=UPI001E360231|nr:xanthine dehydrogenase family protein molybdopterin-binding subunit [Ancylobacter sp. Lp-2]MCB4769308.1 xanthine dehydrogenase family protein molybdopterin-binding subunit [Ancylobacter sp. Lp-2]